jgi:hypothetical protein
VQATPEAPPPMGGGGPAPPLYLGEEVLEDPRDAPGRSPLGRARPEGSVGRCVRPLPKPEQLPGPVSPDLPGWGVGRTRDGSVGRVCRSRCRQSAPGRGGAPERDDVARGARRGGDHSTRHALAGRAADSDRARRHGWAGSALGRGVGHRRPGGGRGQSAAGAPLCAGHWPTGEDGSPGCGAAGPVRGGRAARAAPPAGCPGSSAGGPGHAAQSTRRHAGRGAAAAQHRSPLRARGWRRT